MVILYCGDWRWIPIHNVYWSKSDCRTATWIMIIIVYYGEWRWIPLHNVYWSKSDCRTATWIMTIIHSRTDSNFTTCLWSKLTLIQSKWHTQLSTRLRKFPFRFTLIINYIYMFCFYKCVVLTDTISCLPYFHFHSLN
jgi:hypothetical protein